MQPEQALRVFLYLHAAGPLFNNEGVLLHIGATIIWSDGRRANFQCAFDQALTQYLEVVPLTPHLHSHPVCALMYSSISGSAVQVSHECGL